jgi:thiol:disulfide interchange protein DsbA
MRLLSRLACAIVMIGVAGGCLAAAAQDHPEYIRLKNVQPTDNPGKVEVIEFFWYGCPHCDKLEPAVDAWEKRLPKDVVFRREHVIWPGRSDTETHARLFLTLRAMGMLAQHHKAVFDALHRSKLRLRSEAEIFKWAAGRGIDRAGFEATYKSFGVNAQVARAKAVTLGYSVDGVPNFAVNGKFMASLGRAHDEKRLFEIVDKLVAEERQKK